VREEEERAHKERHEIRRTLEIFAKHIRLTRGREVADKENKINREGVTGRPK